jgi:hypothetical protein
MKQKIPMIIANPTLMMNSIIPNIPEMVSISLKLSKCSGNQMNRRIFLREKIK